MCGYVQAAMAIYSAMRQSEAQQAKGAYDNAVAQYNARVQENQATMTANKGVEAENRQRQQTAQLISQQRAQIGAAGVSLSGGSASSLIQDTAMMGAADAFRIKTNYANEVTAIQQGAQLTLNQGAAAQSMANTQAQNTLISGASSAASSMYSGKWYRSDSSANTQPAMNDSQYSLARSSTSSSYGLRG